MLNISNLLGLVRKGIDTVDQVKSLHSDLQSSDIVGDVKKTADLIYEILNDFLLPDEMKYDRFTYEDMIKYFVQFRPKGGYVKGIFLLAEQRAGKMIAYQFFVDQDDNIIDKGNNALDGRKLFLKEMDQELLNVLGGSDVLIVE